MKSIAIRKGMKPDRIFVEASIENTILAKKIIGNIPHAIAETIADANEFLSKALSEEDISYYHNSLLLARQRGPFLRLCPGTPKHICCLYHNLDIAAGCDMDCSYCILQGYLNNPMMIQYCNLDDMFAELDETLARHPQKFFRIGTGEMSDSLTLDNITEIGPTLIDYFSQKSNAIIELKTKSISIENILDSAHHKRSVISWSLNSKSIATSEESMAPSIDERLSAAKEIQKAGYRLGFHFDPMIVHDGWEDNYLRIVDKIFQFVNPDQIAWISLGALRYPPALDDSIRKKHPNSKIVLGELLKGIDNKYRYFKPIRIKMFKAMHQQIKSYSKDVFVYLCMESKEVWLKSFGWTPKSSAELKQLLDERVRD